MEKDEKRKKKQHNRKQEMMNLLSKVMTESVGIRDYAIEYSVLNFLNFRLMSLIIFCFTLRFWFGPDFFPQWLSKDLWET